MKINTKTKNTLKKILLCVLGVALIFGAFTLVSDYKSEELKTVHVSYHIGDLNNSGAPIENENAMYSDAFECAGLTITPAFDSQVEFKVAFYDSNGQFISLVPKTAVTTTYDVPDLATHARVVLTPKNTYENDDDKIGLIEKIELANDIEIKVFKDQLSYEKVDITADVALNGTYFTNSQTEGSPLVYDAEKEEFTVSTLIEVDDSSALLIKSTTPGQTYRYAILDSSENVIEVDYIKYDGEGMYKIDLPNDAHYVRIVMNISATYDAWLAK
ncbi:MAG: hypothetical protein IJW53_00955 [Clostridia bacterium]|nr:hypothetical protein [Clostridia bacterium]